MSIEANKQIAWRFVELINQWDLDALDEVVDKEHFTEHNPAWGALSFEQALETYKMIKAALPDLHFGEPPVIIAAEDDLVVIRGGVSGTHTGAPLFGVPASGKKLSWSGIDISRISNGKIVERWLEADMVGLMQQVGVIPTPGNGQSDPNTFSEGVSDMAGESHKAIYQRFVEEVVNQGNFNIIPELFAEDYLDHSAPPGAPAGLAGVQATMGMFRTAFPDVHFTILHMVAEGDMVATYVKGEGTHNGPFLGMEPTGIHATWTSSGFFRVSDGLIVEHWGIPDLFALTGQLRGQH